MFKDNLMIALDQLRSGKLRSLLTLLGISIGIATVIAIVSILEGYFTKITNDLNVLGANVFQVEKWDRTQNHQVGAGDKNYRPNLKRRLAQAIREGSPLVARVGAEVWGARKAIQYKDKHTLPNIQIAGAENAFFPNNGYAIADGRALTGRDVREAAKVVVLGMDTVEKLFPFEAAVGKTVKISGHRFKVVGTLEKLGSGTFGGSKDNLVVIPITVFEEIWGSQRSVNITISIKDPKQMDEAKDQVIGIMRRERHIPAGKPNNFALFSNDTLVNNFNDIAKIIQLVAGLLGMISLFVGSIGVMNIMLVTVTERTREIGIRKAIGAQKTAVLTQFLEESVVLSSIGGLIGLIIGMLITLLAASFLDIPFAIPLWSIFASIGITTFVGLAAGIYPAAKAARMDPINALRYE